MNRDTEGMMNAKTILGLILALVITGILIGYVFPIGMDAMHDTNTVEKDMTESSTYEITNELNSTLDDANGTNNYVNLTLTLDNGDTYTVTNLDEGNSTVVSTSAGDMTVKAVSVTSDTEATVSFEYDNDFGWDSSERSIYTILPLFLVLTILVALAGFVLKTVNL